MRNGLLIGIGIGSGLVAALLFFSATQGRSWLSLVLLFLTPLPLLLAGLSRGWLAAAAGALACTLVMGAVAGFSDGIGALLGLGVPATFVAYLAYLSRPAPDRPSGLEWYPVGRLLAVLSLYGGALPVLTLPWIGGSYDGLRPHAIDTVKAAFKESDLEQPTEQQIEAFADMVVAVAPSAMSLYWLLIMVPNLYLAARIVGASGYLARDWPDLPAFAFPVGFSLLLGPALLATFAPGVIGIAGTSFTGALFFAHLLAGLALVHFLARRGAYWILWVVYIGLLVPFFTPYAAILIAAAGLIDPIFKLKQRLGAPPASS